MFDVPSVVYEAPIYVPHLNKLFVTQDGPPGNLSNLVIDLNMNPPTLETFVTDPPVYQPTGDILHDGMIYWAVQGNIQTLPDGQKQRSGVVRVDPATLKAEWLVNNYYGFSFGGLNDLTVDAFGDVWFTDSGTGSPFAYVIINVLMCLYRVRLRPRPLTSAKPDPARNLPLPALNRRHLRRRRHTLPAKRYLSHSRVTAAPSTSPTAGWKS